MARGWLPGVLGLALVLSCERRKASPSEVPPVVLAPAGVAPACLAQTHPLLAHTLRIPRSQLAALTADGRDSRPLGQGDFVYGSVWAPDGRSIAFRRRALFPDAAPVPTELALLVPDGSEQESLLSIDPSLLPDGFVPNSPDRPSWSADGQWLAFASLRDSSHWRVWTIARSGGQLQPLFPELADVTHFDADWSPHEAARVVFVTDLEGAQELWLAERGTGAAPIDLTRGRLASISSPRWSPDGQHIAFSARERGEGARAEPDIFLIDLADGALQRLTQQGANTHPIWSPDATSLIVSSTRAALDGGAEQSENLWRLPIDGGAPRQLTDAQSATVPSDWYPFATCGGR